MFGSVTELASESMAVTTIMYNAFETPITLLLAVFSVGIFIAIVFKVILK